MNDLKYYLAGNKTDDYGNGIVELIHTTQEYSTGYYWTKDVEDADAKVLRKYFNLVDHEEESDRTDDRRFYGTGGE